MMTFRISGSSVSNFCRCLKGLKPMIPSTDLHCITTWIARYSGRNSAMNLLILWFRVSSQMALLFNINISFRLQDQTVPYSSWQAWENIFLHKKVSIYKVYSMISMNTTFLDCKHKHTMKSGAPPDKVRVLHCLLPIEFHGFTRRIDFKGYHTLIPGLISIFFRDGMGPFNLRVEVCKI